MVLNYEFVHCHFMKSRPKLYLKSGNSSMQTNKFLRFDNFPIEEGIDPVRLLEESSLKKFSVEYKDISILAMRLVYNYFE